MNNPDDAILENPWSWEISRFEWNASEDGCATYLDVTFQRDGTTRILRFIAPQDVYIHIPGGRPIECGDMLIRDICDRQLDSLGIQVTEGGASGTPLSLYARTVQLHQKAE